MSTRAVIMARDKRERWSLYCHGDGYPSGLGKMVSDFVDLAPKIDPNNRDYIRPVSYDDPYKFVSNVSSEAGKFIASLAGYLWQQGYTSAYMTNRDPRRELEERGTDIRWLYEIVLKGGEDPVVQVFELTDMGFSLVDGERLEEELGEKGTRF